MAKATKSSGDALAPAPVPDTALWQSPISWIGQPPQPGPFAGEIPVKATFTRATVRLVMSEPVTDIMSRNTEAHLPGLIRLEAGKPVEVHLTGPDGRCWTWRRLKEGRKLRWKLFAGTSFPAATPVEASPIAPSFVEYVYVSSLLTMVGSGRGISFMIRDDGSMEDFSRAADPDPND
jgi:hypothetical protein